MRAYVVVLSCVLLLMSGCIEWATDYGPREVGAPPAPGDPETPPADGAARIVTLNVKRFFDTVCDTGDCGRNAYEQQPSASEFAARADEIAASLRQLAPSAVLLQEIETQTCLDALSQRLRDILPAAVLGETGPTQATVDVAVMTARPITAVLRHRHQVLTRPDGSTTTFAREFLEVHLDADDESDSEIILFAAHFKSKSDDDPGRRLAEAQAATEIVTEAAATATRALVVFGGDLNDVPGSAPIDAIEASGELLRVASELADAGTYSYNGVSQAIDHLFVDEQPGGAYLPGTARVVRNSGGGYGGSDHAALMAEFSLPR